MATRTMQFSIYRYDPDKDDAPYMQDISIEVNPEIDRKLTADGTFYFVAPAEYANILVKGDVDFVTTANNHRHDFAEAGIEDTEAALDAVKMAHAGSTWPLLMASSRLVEYLSKPATSCAVRNTLPGSSVSR